VNMFISFYENKITRPIEILLSRGEVDEGD
jgi:hypothetical protein